MDIKIIDKIGKLKETSTYEGIMEIVEYDFKKAYIYNDAAKEISEKKDEILKNLFLENKLDNVELKYSENKGEYLNTKNWLRYTVVNDIIKSKSEGSIFDADLSVKEILGETYIDCINSMKTLFFDYIRNNTSWINDYQEEYKKCELYRDFWLLDKFSDYSKDLNSSILKEFETFANLTHSIGNYMPFPPSDKNNDNYNTAKGFLGDVKDFLPLMIDKIENCIANKICQKYKYNGNPVTVSLNVLESWKEFFLQNREKFLLEEYYFVIEQNGIKKMIGIPLFKTQSLSHTIPLSEEEFKECIEEMNRRIKTRGTRMVINFIIKNIENAVDN
ncbi:hypothetical protein [Clostridium kluyveri]|uniref:Uncharacterized protein n=1 Tax=Clostridium kluyveri TaxID=1534 RepID=A0A1L5FDC1_CLOKL|nr:hypothetical protein [Clostridium kluyveri]APM40977.1 hypothetical protein BS101_20830 [Clostridium kluyveri]UZQ48748.1 hypothetical protein OP486_12220 [Clostridium kluyveri]